MLLTLQNIGKSFGAEVVLKDVSAVVDKNDRIGIVGENGAGKTTLVKLITGEYDADAGDIVFAQGTRLGYLAQNSALDQRETVYGEMKRAFQPVLDALHEMEQIGRALEEANIDASRRAETLSMEEFARLADCLREE